VPFRFQKRIRLAKGVSLNLSRKGISSVRVGRRGLGVSTGKRGTRVGVSAPGTGLSASRKVGTGCLVPLVVAVFVITALL
jgi:hypothetical protein